jgi:hypothetical protein
MNIDDYIKKDLNRRNFLKKSVQATLAGTAVFSLKSLLSCAPALNETRRRKGSGLLLTHLQINYA